MKTREGFTQFYETIGMLPCLDPLHSVSARPSIDGSKTVYEAVNKESRKNFFIGMHNEFVGTRAPRAAAFCCFKAAETGGEVSERSVRALRKTSILAMKCAKWLQRHNGYIHY